MGFLVVQFDSNVMRAIRKLISSREGSKRWGVRESVCVRLRKRFWNGESVLLSEWWWWEQSDGEELRLAKEQYAFLEESFKEHNTVNPISQTHTDTRGELAWRILLSHRKGKYDAEFYERIQGCSFHNNIDNYDVDFWWRSEMRVRFPEMATSGYFFFYQKLHFSMVMTSYPG